MSPALLREVYHLCLLGLPKSVLFASFPGGGGNGPLGGPLAGGAVRLGIVADCSPLRGLKPEPAERALALCIRGGKNGLLVGSTAEAGSGMLSRLPKPSLLLRAE